MDAMGESYELIFINDGSHDRSPADPGGTVPASRPDVTRVVLFNGNFGQHMAILAGLRAHARDRIVITLDADLQNPPEEIRRLVAAMGQGHDYVGTIRRQRNDTAFRR